MIFRLVLPVTWAAARHRRQGPRSRCFYCVTPRARAQTRSVSAAEVAIVCKCPR